MTAADKTLTPRTDLIERLRKRAAIRRQIPGRKSVQNGEPDRIADLLDEAADDLAAKTREVAEVTEQRDAAANACERESLAKLQAQSRAEQAERELAEAKADLESMHNSLNGEADARLKAEGELSEAKAAYKNACAQRAAINAEAERLREALNWIERHLIEGKWDGTLGRPKSWHMVGPYRHALAKMVGNTLLDAIDAARQGGV